jgi:hypothetical protein
MKLEMIQPVGATPWSPIVNFKKTKRSVEKTLPANTGCGIRYFLMAKRNGDVVANWYVGKGSGWFFGSPMEDFIAYAEVIKPRFEKEKK